MEIWPVLDLLSGTVVRGVAGRRSEYAPIRSPLTQDSSPIAVATAIRNRFELNTLYVADLDAILHQRPNRTVYEALSSHGFSLAIDAGLRSANEALRLLRELTGCKIRHLIIGLESFANPEELPGLVQHVADEFPDVALCFSLDLKFGIPMCSSARWPIDPVQIARIVAAAGIAELIVLDLAAVGVSSGVPTPDLCEQIVTACPGLSIITGGGVRGVQDLHTLRDAGISAVLIASAIHDGQLSPDDLRLV